ncbi:unnamed protein product [Hymenolepis diminuta]|uniref:Protein kinase domain-containing protein n=1 Tax=Hymenolepis diminuta TaxID=6216 RepID=A0A564Z6I4_HYMDI|nr:unnamed protein product [Hymenolepis diminuta]
MDKRRSTAEEGVKNIDYLRYEKNKSKFYPGTLSRRNNLVNQGRQFTSLIDLSSKSFSENVLLSYASSVEDLPNSSCDEESYRRERIGKGMYSVVYKCQKGVNGPIYAEKVIKMNKEEGAPGTAIWEASLLKKLRHQNIIALHEIRYVPGQLYILLEYARYNLNTYMQTFPLSSSHSSVQRLTRQFFLGLKYIHDESIIHRDLKPENILITENGTLKIADFGLARQVCLPVTSFGTRVVTLWYKSPELLLDLSTYGKEIDVWSAGCIVYEMMMGTVLFRGFDPESQLRTIFEDIGVPSTVYWPELHTYPNFQRIKSTIRQFGPEISDVDPEKYNVQARLLPKFERQKHRHWLSRTDAFQLLEMCLQPHGSKRITVKEALMKMTFLSENSPTLYESDFTSISFASDSKSSTDSNITSTKLFSSTSGLRRPPGRPKRLTEIPNLNLNPTFTTEIANTFPPAIPERKKAGNSHTESLKFSTFPQAFPFIAPTIPERIKKRTENNGQQEESEKLKSPQYCKAQTVRLSSTSTKFVDNRRKNASQITNGNKLSQADRSFSYSCLAAEK